MIGGQWLGGRWLGGRCAGGQRAGGQWATGLSGKGLRQAVAGLIAGLWLACSPVAVGQPATVTPAPPAPPAPPASAPALLPVAMFYRHPDIAQVQLSPSGRYLAVSMDLQGRLGLAVIDLQGQQKAKVLVRDERADIRSFEWVNDQRLVFSLIDLEAGGGDQGFGPGLFSVGLDGGAARMLVRVRRDFVAAPAVGVPPLDALHHLLMVPAGAAGDEVVVGHWRLDGSNNLDSVQPLRLNVVTGRSRSLALGMPDKVKRWLFDPQGEPRVAVARHQGAVTVWWRAPGSPDWVELARHPFLDAPFNAHSVDSAGQLYVTVTEPGEAGILVLKRFDFKTGRPEAAALARAPGFDFRGSLLHDPGRSPQPGEGALGLRLTTDAETTVWFTPALARLQAAVDQRLPGRVNRISCRRCSADDAVVLVQSWSDQDPGQLWLHRPALGEASGQWQRVAALRKDVDPQQMATQDLHRFKARDGLEIPVWITQARPAPAGAGPPPQKPVPRPAVVLVHGGPWVRGNSWHWSADAQFLASRGYVVIEPEFRGSTGYGRRLYHAGLRQWGRAMQDDVADAVRWAVAQGWVDGQRVCIAGASYGGYATLMGLVRDPGLYRCGVAWAAVSDPRLMFKWQWISDQSDEVRQYDYPALIGDPVADAAMLTDIAAVTHAARIRAPLLLVHGQMDRRVPVAHAEAMRDAMAAAGHPPEWVIYPDEGHGWLKPANRLDFARRLERFLAEQLK